MEKEDKNHILYTIDGLIRSVKLRNIAALWDTLNPPKS